MLCPTDHLEPVIHDRFKGQKYFYSSLGNTAVFDKNTLEQIAKIIEKNGIEEITFVLSEDNIFVQDALDKQNFIDVRGLKEAYNHFHEHKNNTLRSWVMYNQRTIILSYHLNEKMKELQSGLRQYLSNLPTINGKLFSKPYNSFRQIYSDLVCINSLTLN